MSKKKIKVAVYLKTAPDNDNEFEIEKENLLSLLDTDKVSIYKIYADRNFKDKYWGGDALILESTKIYEEMVKDMKNKKFSAVLYRDISHSEQRIEDAGCLTGDCLAYNCDYILINNKKAFSSKKGENK